jgi:ABC-2 type transport system permease protein
LGLKQVIALILKDLKLLVRDKVGFFFAFFFPLIYCIFFGTLFSGGGGGSRAIKVLVVDEDQSEASKEFVAALEKTPEFSVELTSRTEAERQVRKGDRTAYIALPVGFGSAKERMFWGDPAKIETGIDPARKAEAGMIHGVLTKCAFEGLQQFFTNPEKNRQQIRQWLADIQADPDMDPQWRTALSVFLPAWEVFLSAQPKPTEGRAESSFRWNPVEIEDVPITREWRGPKNSYEVSFPQGVIWGVMGCAAAFGISLVIERTKGTLVRLRMAPLRREHILAGKAGACFFVTAGLQVAVFIIGMVFFKIRPGSMGLLAFALFSVTCAFVGIMMVLSVLGKTEQAAGGIGWSVLVLMAMIGGGMIPQFVMPPWLHRLGVISPVKWSITAMDGAIWRGFSFVEMLLPCGILIGVGVVCFAIGAQAFQWSEE